VRVLDKPIGQTCTLGELPLGELDWVNMRWANLYWAKDHGIYQATF